MEDSILDYLFICPSTHLANIICLLCPYCVWRCMVSVGDTEMSWLDFFFSYIVLFTALSSLHFVQDHNHYCRGERQSWHVVYRSKSPSFSPQLPLALLTRVILLTLLMNCCLKNYCIHLILKCVNVLQVFKWAYVMTSLQLYSFLISEEFVTKSSSKSGTWKIY